MHKSKLFRILNKIKIKEFRRFEEFVNSPYYNKNDKVSLLLKIIKKSYPNLDSRNLLIDRVYGKIFPKEKFDEKKLRHIMSYLTKLLEQFLMQQEFEKRTDWQNSALLRQFRSKELANNFQAKSASIHNDFEKRSILDQEFYFHRFLFDKVLYEENTQKRGQDTALPKLVKSLDLFYITHKLWYSLELVNRRKMLAQEYDLKLLQEILQHVQQNDYSHAPAIPIYYQIIQTLKDPDDETHYHQLIRELDQNASTFSHFEQQYIYLFARNYCIRQINSGKPHYLKELFVLYKILLEKGLFIQNNHLRHETYKNIVTVALRLNELDWTKKFIQDYKSKLNKKYREHAYTYNMANWHFAAQEYGEVLSLLNTVEFIDVFYQLSVRALLTKTYYELTEDQALESLLESFRIYLLRNKAISTNTKKLYNNFIKVVKKLYRTRINPNKNNNAVLADISNDVKNLHPVAALDWIELKIQELVSH